MKRERKTLLTARCLRINPRSRSVSISSAPYSWSSLTLLPLHRGSSLISFPPLAGRHPPAAVGSVPLHDGPDAGPDGGHRDSQTLCLQPAGGRAHSGPTELALPKGHIWNPCYWCAGRPRNEKSWVKRSSGSASSLKRSLSYIVTLLTLFVFLFITVYEVFSNLG